MIFNFSSAIHPDLPGYVHVLTCSVESRRDYGYQLISNTSKDIESAAQTVYSLIAQNLGLCHIVDASLDSLRTLISAHPCLIASGRMMCLCAMPTATEPDFRDFVRYFSKTSVEDLPKCKGGRFFEGRYIVIWTQKHEDTCSAGKHPFGPLGMDLGMQSDTLQYRQAQQERAIVKRAEQEAARVAAFEAEVERVLLATAFFI